MDGLGAKLYNRLKPLPGLDGRVFTGHAHPGTPLPYMVLGLLAAGRDYTHEGHSGLSSPYYQVIVYAATAQEAWDITRQAVESLESWRTDGVKMAFVQGQQGFSGGQAGDTLDHYRIITDVRLWHVKE